MFVFSCTDACLEKNVGQAWGLASISSRTKNTTDYVYNSSAGDGTFSYVIDTGVRTTHKEFEGRAIWGFNAANDQDTDDAGHGT